METGFEGIAMAGIVLPRKKDAGDAAEGPGSPVNNLEATLGGEVKPGCIHCKRSEQVLQHGLVTEFVATWMCTCHGICISSNYIYNYH